MNRLLTAAAASVCAVVIVAGQPTTSTVQAEPNGPAVVDAADVELTAVASRTVTRRLRGAIRDLKVTSETRTGYDRSKFTHWIDADRDCRDTRDEVLAAESKVAVSGCDIRTGKWVSYYDRVTVRNSSDLDIDHVVALAEAWDSGARRWNADTRKRFANDLRDGRSLVAVTASSNRSKSDRDPAEWMPRYGKCRYVKHWVAVKTRWSLTVNRAEKRALLDRASRCTNSRLTVTKARIGTGTTSGGGDTGGDTGGTDPRYDTCSEAIAHGYGPYYQGRDPEYDWYRDSDGDGVVCES